MSAVTFENEVEDRSQVSSVVMFCGKQMPALLENETCNR